MDTNIQTLRPIKVGDVFTQAELIEISSDGKLYFSGGSGMHSHKWENSFVKDEIFQVTKINKSSIRFIASYEKYEMGNMGWAIKVNQYANANNYLNR